MNIELTAGFLLYFTAHAGPLSRYPALMDTLLGSHYAEAGQICEAVTAENPGHPAAFYAKACLLYSRYCDFEDTTGRSEFLSLVTSCVHACDSLLNNASSHRERAELSYLRGSALSIHGLTLEKDGNLFRAVQLLMSAGRWFDRAIESDSTFYDAYLGRGAYRYTVATKASFLGWLPFIPDKSSGWSDLWLAVDSSTVSRDFALSSMVWLIMDTDLELADSICAKELERYPNSRIFLWPRLAIEKRREEWQAASKTARQLLNQYLSLPENNGYDVTGLYATLMTCADDLGHPQAAKEYAQKGLEAKRTPYAEKRRNETLRKLQKRLEQNEP
jgi:hypothetical protein